VLESKIITINGNSIFSIHIIIENIFDSFKVLFLFAIIFNFINK